MAIIEPWPDQREVGTVPVLPMQTDETRAREVLGATKHADDCAMLTALHTDYCDCDRAIRAMLAFAAPPAVERALHPALPLIEAIAKWERENGTLAAIMPSEYGDFCRLMADAAVHGSARAVTLHPSDREAIAAVIANVPIERFAKWAAEGTKYPNAYQSAIDDAYRKADAILALSGSLAAANPTEKGDVR